MANETIEKIRDAEAQALEITAQAGRQAAQSVAAARAAASEKMEAAQLQVRQIAAAAQDAHKKQSDACIDAGRRDARVQAKKMVAAAEENMKTAVNEIIREIFEKWQ